MGSLFEDVYKKPYVRKVVDTLLNGLDVLAVLSLDVPLLFWIKGLKHELRERIKEIEKKEKEKVEREKKLKR
jgi:hypothetical protein